MKHWTELRTALLLARYGTVSAAADALGVHRATVSRHIDTLEQAFGTRLFQRHARGYSLTDTGREMFDVVGRAEETFVDLIGRSRGKSGQLSGSLVITALSGIAPMIVPLIQAFQRTHPGVEVEFVAGAQLARLEYGEAHVAFRAGAKPETPDYVVGLFRRVRFGLYASQEYIDHAGQPDIEALHGHRFVGTLDPTSALPVRDWMMSHVPKDRLTLKTLDQNTVHHAVTSGLGLGFLAQHDAQSDSRLVEILPPRNEWSVPIWTVTHVDLHRTSKIHEFLQHVRQRPGASQA